MLCQNIVGAGSGPGDSGSPVFELLQGNRVVLAGIMWGGAEDGSDFAFTAMPEIEAELGAMDFFSAQLRAPALRTDHNLNGSRPYGRPARYSKVVLVHPTSDMFPPRISQDPVHADPGSPIPPAEAPLLPPSPNHAHGQETEDKQTLDSLTDRGYCLLPGGITDQDRAALLAESRALGPSARAASGDYYRVNGDGSLSSPRRLSTIAAGPVLEAIHRDEQRLEQLERIAGRRVSPTRGSFIYYEPGDYIGLHKDAAACQITLITSVSGALEPLIVHPSLAAVPLEELLAISRAHSGMPSGGTRVAIPRGGMFLMLLGSRSPSPVCRPRLLHHRDPLLRLSHEVNAPHDQWGSLNDPRLPRRVRSTQPDRGPPRRRGVQLTVPRANAADRS